MKKYVVETWLRIESVLDTEQEAQARADSYLSQENYKDTKIVVLESTPLNHPHD